MDARLEWTWVHAVSVTPNINGFVGAQDELRQRFGAECTFHVPQPPVYAAGTRINPDTGEPYSAMAVRTNNAFADVVRTVLIIVKQGSPLRPQSDTHVEAAGMLSGMDIILDVADEDKVDTASEFTINGLRYKLEEWKPFSVGGQMYRWLCYGMER